MLGGGAWGWKEGCGGERVGAAVLCCDLNGDVNGGGVLGMWCWVRRKGEGSGGKRVGGGKGSVGEGTD